jgi:hypothetical protein
MLYLCILVASPSQWLHAHQHQDVRVVNGVQAGDLTDEITVQ